jgi:hypothetical protein
VQRHTPDQMYPLDTVTPIHCRTFRPACSLGPQVRSAVAPSIVWAPATALQ